MPILQQIDNPELLIGFIFVVISLVGLVGGNVTISNFTVKFNKTAKAGSLANISLFVVLGLGIVIILSELFRS